MQRKPHATSRYAAVSDGVIDHCQRGLAEMIPGMDPTKAAVIAAESREADQLATMPPEAQAKRKRRRR